MPGNWHLTIIALDEEIKIENGAAIFKQLKVLNNRLTRVKDHNSFSKFNKRFDNWVELVYDVRYKTKNLPIL